MTSNEPQAPLGARAHSNPDRTEGDRIRRQKWNAPIGQRIPSLLYLAAALVCGAIDIGAYMSPHGNDLFAWIVEGDRRRPLASPVVAVVVLVSAIATVIRAHMRGIILSEQWLEARYLLPGGIPRSRRWAWQQIGRIVIGRHEMVVELPTGHALVLPEVEDREGFAAALERFAAAHAFDVDRT